MEIRVNCQNGTIEKTIQFLNGRIKQHIYEKCKEIIICRNPLLDNLVISVYPSPKTLIGRYKAMMAKQEKEEKDDDIFIFN